MKIAGIWLAQFAVVMLSGASSMLTSAPGDFAIKLEFGYCSTDVIDTFNGI
jgi:hypothetical protein